MVAGSSLGKILVEAGVIDDVQLEGYNARERTTKRPCVQLMLEDELFSEQEMAQALSTQLGVPFVMLNQLRIPGYVAKLIPREMALKLQVIPVSTKNEGNEEVLYVAFFDPTTAETLAKIEEITHKPVKVVVSTASQIQMAIDRYLRPVKGPSGKRKRTRPSFNRDPEATQTAAPSSPDPWGEVSSTSEDAPEKLPEIQADALPPIPDEQGEPEQAEILEAEPVEIDVEEEAGQEQSKQADDDFAGIDLIEDSEIADSDDLGIEPVAAVTETGTQAAPEIETEGGIELDDVSIDLDLDLDMGELESPSPQEQTEDSAAESDSFIELDDKPEADSGESSDFLSLNMVNFANEDDEILKRQEEATKTRQEHAFGMDNDLDFSDIEEESEEKSDGEHFSLDDDPFDDFDIEEPGAASSAAKPDGKDKDLDWDDESFEFGVQKESGPIEADQSSSKSENELDDSDDDLDDFDFDIPEAPEFEDSPSGSYSSLPALGSSKDKETSQESSDLDDFSVDGAESEDEQLSPDKAADASEDGLGEDDWSLDLEDLYDNSKSGVIQTAALADASDVPKETFGLDAEPAEAPDTEDRSEQEAQSEDPSNGKRKKKKKASSKISDSKATEALALLEEAKKMLAIDTEPASPEFTLDEDDVDFETAVRELDEFLKSEPDDL